MDSLGLLSELVALDTVSGEAAPQRRAMDSIVSLVLSRAPQAKVESDLTGNHPWALITNEAAPSAARLLFACHVDTVPVGTVSDWEFDPYAAQVDGELFLGRGTSDMKAGLVAATAAVVDAFERGVPVALLLTSDEEIGSLGAARSADAVANLEVGAVIVPEATGNRINLGHRGALWLEVSVKGKAAHGSTPQRGTNAVLKLLDVVDRARRELPLSSDAFLGAETWNLGLVGGGSAPNIVPDNARAVIDHRTVGDGADLLAWWRAQPEVDSVETSIHLGGVRTDASDPWLATLPIPVATEPVSYFTDASVLAAAAPGAPVVIWGPGTPSLMHAANESVKVSELDDAIAAYGAVAAAWPTVD
ncbi:MAG: hydrolase [Rhodococcus erythropolis]|jgi:succinyl-diaminopimelate desuccinylase|uniref:M20/M25/M40 family metallo-hydrolase n=1 Tax=Rhodococcus TaxID=1827 RepID=UPI000307A99D|nr:MULTISPECIES: M20/M25/M40 family metallo-hydrolase [Rhodococcus]MBF7732941.1 M20/M25/M40 family metallo-hydrolase [Rhodococcus erythropolis]MBS2992146.1 M20/M25/M40 family metallo-hydrolase [Rhodococcus erythropolis]MBY6389008.1 M20 family metallopeptidase [Rhodococcus erythropolis]MCQ4122938.1 M20/M25/M40 family metallo-hydrolase [Rhodococcus erythropolis]MCS4251830.1 succinyl-diaminopimelate desuccinylase [Rhodococcus erythropolis]